MKKYVKCIESCVGFNCKDKIYDIDKDKPVCCEFDDIYIWEDLFRDEVGAFVESTKEEYDKQFNKFIPGRWYKYAGSYYGKCSTAAQPWNNRFYYDERIYIGYYVKIHDWIGLDWKPVLLEDLSEIQQYLPEGHPDKFLTSIKLVIGEIYYRDGWIFDYVSPNPYKCNNIAISPGHEFFLKKAAMADYNSKPDRLATLEEKKWLNTCVEQNKFISLNLLDLFDDNGVLKIGAKKDNMLIEKWSVGSYIVPLQDRLLTRLEPLIKGKPYIIINDTYTTPYIQCEQNYSMNFAISESTEKTEGIKWFATLKEAKEFSEELLSKDEPKQNSETTTNKLKAVHVKTQEEWDFVTKNLGYYWATGRWDRYKENSVISLVDKAFDCFDWYNKNNYEIMSYEDWCKENGYMKENKETKFEISKWYKDNKLNNSYIYSTYRNGNEYYGYGLWAGKWGSKLGIRNDSIEASEEEVKEALLKYAHDKYTIGIKFKSINKEEVGIIREVIPYSEADKEVFWNFDSNNSVVYSSNGIKCDSRTCSNPTIYKDGKWAEIVTEDRKEDDTYPLDVRYKPGDKVKILRKAKYGERGWKMEWIPKMDLYIGLVQEVKKDLADIGVELEHFTFPHFVLEKVDKSKDISNKDEEICKFCEDSIIKKINFKCDHKIVMSMTNGTFCSKAIEEYHKMIETEMKDSFILPEKWCIKPKDKEEAFIIGKWFDENYGCKYYKTYYQDERSLMYHKYGEEPGHVYSNRPDYEFKEITFEQFRKYVLEESLENRINNAVADMYGIDVVELGKPFLVDTSGVIPEIFTNMYIAEPTKPNKELKLLDYSDTTLLLESPIPVKTINNKLIE